ncbi:hypothetical protein V8E52_001703 [Russula decolorans]|jgi:hypothetical protein
MGYECHPETDQSTIARERLEERLLNRKIHIQVRGTTCTDCRRKARKQIQSGFGTHNTGALGTGAASFCGEDRVLHRLRRQHTRFAASEYVLHVRAKTIPGHCRPSFLVMRLRSGLVAWWHHRDSERSHPRYSRCPSFTCAHLEKYLLHFHIFPDLTNLTAQFHRAPVRKITTHFSWVPFSCLFGPSLTEYREGKDGVIWAEAAKVQTWSRSALGEV